MGILDFNFRPRGVSIISATGTKATIRATPEQDRRVARFKKRIAKEDKREEHRGIFEKAFEKQTGIEIKKRAKEKAKAEAMTFGEKFIGRRKEFKKKISEKGMKFKFSARPERFRNI